MARAPMLKLFTLGGVRIEQEGEPLTQLASRKTEALLLYLAVTRRAHAREVLAELLWDDRSQEQALSNLRVVLSSLRKHLSPYLSITRQSVAMSPGSEYWLDLEEVRAAIEGARRDAGVPEGERLALLERAVALYQGEFLEGFYLPESRAFEEWALLQRENLHRLVLEALGELSTHYLETGAYERGLSHVTRLLELDPLREEAHRRAMLLLARRGERSAALRQYERCRAILQEELGVEPTEPTTALYHRLRAATALGTHNLPAPATPFVGRERERALLLRRLTDPGCRLLTVLGPGGIGKTRLALQVAGDLVASRPGAFLDGLRFVSLASLSTAAHLVSAVAAALPLAFREGAPPEMQLLDYLRGREMLLLLDNVEPLLADEGSVAWLAALLGQARGVKVLATSRERLHLQEEWIVDVGGLSYPPPGEVGEDFFAFGAPQLFLQSARRARHNFAPDAAEREAIARVCSLVGGMPLAIELAAAWVRQQGCAEIARQVETSLDFLSTPARNVPARHRSLRHLFEHSWSLLAEEERRAARRLALFEGPFQIKAATTVARCSPVVPVALVDKSILGQAQPGYFEWHGLVREFLNEKLAAAPEEAEEARARHAAFYASLLEEEGALLRGPEQKEAMARIGREQENARAAWRWAAERGDLPRLRAMLAPLFLFYENRGSFLEGETLLLHAIEALSRCPEEARAAEEAGVLAELLARRARLTAYLGRNDEAEALLRQSLALVGEEASMERSLALGYLAIVQVLQGDYEAATGNARESLALCRAHEHASGIAFSQNLLGIIAQKRGEYGEAEGRFREALQMYELASDLPGVARLHNNLGNVAQARGAYEKAKAHYLRGTSLFRQVENLHGVAATLSNSGYVAWKLGQYEEAKSLYLESLALKRALNNKRSIATTLANLGDLSVSIGEHEAARYYFRDALQLAVEGKLLALQLDILTGLADLYLQSGNEERAIPLFHLTRDHPGSSEENRERSAARLTALGDPAPGDPLTLERAVARALD